MGTERRDAWGLRCVHAGAGLRWAATCLAGSVVACVALGLPAMWLLGRAYPSPFGLLAGAGHAVSAGGWCLQGAAVALACFAALRAVSVAVTVSAWLLASPELRLALAGDPRSATAQSAKN